MKKVKLTQKQLEILAQIAQEKQVIQNEFAKVVKRESDVVVSIAESNGIVLGPEDSVSFQDGELVFVTQSKTTKASRKQKDKEKEEANE